MFNASRVAATRNRDSYHGATELKAGLVVCPDLALAVPRLVAA